MHRRAGQPWAPGPPIDRPDELAWTAVYTKREAGRRVYRIPAIVETLSGDLLAFAEGRVDSFRDHGNIDLVVRRSSDGGATWGPISVVQSGDGDSAGNPCPVVDRRTGRIVLLFVRAPPDAASARIWAGEFPQARTAWVTTSDDEGTTWSRPREITSEAKKPDWHWYALGPGHAIQLVRGDDAGRLVFPANHSTQPGGFLWCGGHLLLSDDGGETYRIGAIDSPGNGIVNPNETTVVELEGGRLLANARNNRGTGPGTRAVAYSSDGGESFESPYAPAGSLRAPVVQASILRYAAVDLGGNENCLLFASASDPEQRRDLLLRTSRDEGRSWTAGPMIHRGPAAYCDLVVLQSGLVGVLYEGGDDGPFETIRFARFGMAWAATRSGPLL